MFRSHPGRLAGLHRQAWRDALASTARLSQHGTWPHTAWSLAGTRLSRLAAAAAAVTVGLLASVAAIPAAFAQQIPAGLHRRAPVASVLQATGHPAAGTAGLAGWQIALIGVGVPLAVVVVTVLLRRARAGRSAAPRSAA